MRLGNELRSIFFNVLNMVSYAPPDGVSRRATAKVVKDDGVSEIASLSNQMPMFNKKFDKLNATVVSMLVGCERSLSSNMETNLNAHVNAITTRSGKQTTDPPFTSDEIVVKPVNQKENDKVKSQRSPTIARVKTPLKLYEPILPYPGWSKKEKEAEQYKDLSTVIMSEECSAILDGELPKNKSDPGSFTIPCLIRNLSVHNALADLGASINLMPYSMYAKLDMDEDSKVLLILGQPFFSTFRCLVDVYEKKMTLRVDDEEVIFYIDKSMKYSPKKDDALYYIDTIEPLVEENFQEIFEEDLFDTNFIRGEDINMSNEELKDLPPHLEYAFLKSESKPPVIISSNLIGNEKEKLIEVLKANKEAIASDIKHINPSYCTHKILLADEYKPVVQPQ
ncbi:hypothetical protein Tco_0797187 [Tanacetum coccineum]